MASSSSEAAKSEQEKSEEGPSSDMRAFREILSKAKNIVVLSGAGISAESGIPTFRGAGGYWRKYDATQLATPEAFFAHPSLVWEFYSHRREVATSKAPNAGHKAVADLESRLTSEGKSVTVVTQNIDRLHHRAGSKNIIEMHGTLFKTRCTSCGQVSENYDIPIVPSLEGKGAPEPHVEDASISVDDLPKCGDCSGLLRPHVVWFGEGLEVKTLQNIDKALKKCDLFLLIGTSSVVYPAASYAPMLAARGVPVAEFNLETTSVTQQLGYHFQGKCGTVLPEALAPFSADTQVKSEANPPD